MITKKDAIEIGRAICKVAEKVTADNQAQSDLRHMGRGTCIYAMDNLWYDVLPIKVRDQFGLNKDAFYKACGWPA